MQYKLNNVQWTVLTRLHIEDIEILLQKMHIAQFNLSGFVVQSQNECLCSTGSEAGYTIWQQQEGATCHASPSDTSGDWLKTKQEKSQWNNRNFSEKEFK